MANPQASESYWALKILLHQMACPHQLTVAQARTNLEAKGYSVVPDEGEDAKFCHGGSPRLTSDTTVPLDACAEVVPAETTILLDYLDTPPVCVPGGGRPRADCPAEPFLCLHWEGPGNDETIAAFPSLSQPEIVANGSSSFSDTGYFRFDSGGGTCPADGHVLALATPGKSYRFDFESWAFSSLTNADFTVGWLSGTFGSYTLLGTAALVFSGAPHAERTLEATAPTGTVALWITSSGPPGT